MDVENEGMPKFEEIRKWLDRDKDRLIRYIRIERSESGRWIVSAHRGIKLHYRIALGDTLAAALTELDLLLRYPNEQLD